MVLEISLLSEQLRKLLEDKVVLTTYQNRTATVTLTQAQHQLLLEKILHQARMLNDTSSSSPKAWPFSGQTKLESPDGELMQILATAEGAIGRGHIQASQVVMDVAYVVNARVHIPNVPSRIANAKRRNAIHHDPENGE